MNTSENKNCAQGELKDRIQIRFNTEYDRNHSDTSLLPWRVVVNGVERLASEIRVSVPTWTTRDVLANGLIKWHLTCDGFASWDDSGVCRISESPK